MTTAIATKESGMCMTAPALSLDVTEFDRTDRDGCQLWGIATITCPRCRGNIIAHCRITFGKFRVLDAELEESTLPCRGCALHLDDAELATAVLEYFQAEREVAMGY